MKTAELIDLAFQQGKAETTGPYNSMVSLRNAASQMLLRRGFARDFAVSLRKSPSDTKMYSLTITYLQSPSPSQSQPTSPSTSSPIPIPLKEDFHSRVFSATFTLNDLEVIRTLVNSPDITPTQAIRSLYVIIDQLTNGNCQNLTYLPMEE